MRWSEADVAAYLGRATGASADEPEDAFQARIIRLASTHAWLAYHTHDSRRSPAGFPDVVLVRETVLWIECKTRTGKLTHAQEVWLAMLTRAGQECYIWRPGDWPQIQARLTRPRQATP